MDKQVEKLLQAEQQMNEQVKAAQQRRNDKMVEIESNVRDQVANLQRRLKEETREKIAAVSELISAKGAPTSCSRVTLCARTSLNRICRKSYVSIT